jgi:hypothetical protein
MSSQPCLPGKAADNLIMTQCRRTALGFSVIQGPKLLTLRRCSFLDIVAIWSQPFLPRKAADNLILA